MNTISWLVIGLICAGSAAGTAVVLKTSGPFSSASNSDQIATADPTSLPTQAAETAAFRVTTITGGPASKGPPKGGPPGVAQFQTPTGIAVTDDGTVYVADVNNHVVVRIDPSGNSVILAGSGKQDVIDGAATDAAFFGPSGVALGKDGSVYVADGYGNRIRRIDANGNVTTIAGGGEFGTLKGGFRDGDGAEARFFGLAGMAVDLDGTLLVADTGNHRIRRITTSGTVTTAVGTGTVGSADGPALTAGLAVPSAVAVGPDGSIWITEHGNNDVRRMSRGVVTTVIARGSALQPDSVLSYPSGIAVDAAGAVYVTDSQGNRVLRLDAAGGAPAVVAGSKAASFVDGAGSTAGFNRPTGVAYWATGNALVVADSENAAIRRVATP